MHSLNEPGDHSSGYKSKSIAEQSLAELLFPELNANQLRMLEKHLLEIVGDDYEPQFKDNRLVQVYTDGINSTKQTIRDGINRFVGGGTLKKDDDTWLEIQARYYIEGVE